MKLNSKFNFAYCLIFLFYPISSCVDLLADNLFCSSIRASYVTQLYKIIFLVYVGESIKMCSNIFYILIAVNRYMLIDQEHNSILENISKWDKNWLIAISRVTSLVFNIGHCFEFVLNDGEIVT
jgi:hypothetical protein